MRIRIIFPLILSCMLMSCQTIEPVFQQPKVSLNSVDISGISFSGVNLIVNIDVQNPNSVSIPMPNIDWELFINAAHFIDGALPGNQNIRARETATIALPLSFTYNGLYRTFASLIELKEAAYNIALEVSFPSQNIPLISDRVYNLDYAGVLPLPQLPKLSFGSFEITKIDFTGIELAWGINVENPNVFPLPFPELSWNYNVNGIRLLASSLSAGGDIAAGAAGTALISAGITYADVFRVADSLRSQGEASSSLSLDTGLPIPAFEGLKSSLNVPGTFPILHMPEVTFREIARQSLGTTMVFIVSLEVDNKNTFGLGIEEFRYNFGVNNKDWATGRLDNPPQVRANGRTIIPLTVSVNSLDIVRELVGIISQGSAITYNCTGNMSFLPDLPGLSNIDLPIDIKGNTNIRTN